MVEKERMYINEDTHLILKVTEGDAKAYDRLYRKYFPVVISFLTSLDGQLQSPEDLAQEVFTRIWENRARYRPHAAFKTYLFGCAKNVLREHQARATRESCLSAANLSVQRSTRLQIDAVLKADNRVNSLEKLVAKLPDRQRQVFELVYINGFAPRKVAETLRCSVHAVHDNLYRARRNLRRLGASLPMKTARK